MNAPSILMLNPTLSRMKSLLSPSLSTLSPILSNPRSSFSPISLPLMLNFPSFSAPLSPSFLHEKPLFCHNSSSSNGFSLNKEGFKGPSGEIHVILGPMFAGKTTTLLRRVRAESLDGRLGLKSLLIFISFWTFLLKCCVSWVSVLDVMITDKGQKSVCFFFFLHCVFFDVLKLPCEFTERKACWVCVFLFSFMCLWVF